MTITEITALDKKRSKVYIDGEFAFVLYNTELREYKIRQDSQLDDVSYRIITEELLPKRATKRAMNLMQKKDYTEKQLRDKLSDGMYSQECIDAAVQYVKSYHYLDDERYARDYITYQMELRSKSRIIRDLMGKGIDKDLCDRLVSELYDGADSEVESEQIRKLLIKKRYDANMDFKDKQKIMAFLVRRGYSIETVKREMEKCDF